MSVIEIKKEKTKKMSFEEMIERNIIIVVVVLILLVLVGLPMQLAIILSVLITIYFNHVKNKKWDS